MQALARRPDDPEDLNVDQPRKLNELGGNPPIRQSSRNIRVLYLVYHTPVARFEV